MKFTTPLLAAGLAASAQAAEAAGSVNGASVTAVLATALPPSLLSLAITNPGSASRVISSEFAAGETPAWFSHLPHDVQTYLVPAAAPAPTMPSIKPMNGANMSTPITTKKMTTNVPGGTTVKGVTATTNVGTTPPPSSSTGQPAAAAAIGVPGALLTTALFGAFGLLGMLVL